MASSADRPYHHGDLRRALITAAVGQIETGGPSRVSMRDIARLAGVSHAAPAHHFGDKTGLFTAIAAEGFTLLAAVTTPMIDEPDALLRTGVGYITFAIAHRGHFEVMYRPDLHREDDPALAQARERSFANFYIAVRRAAGLSDDADITGLATAAWSVVHGFATLWLAGNFREQLPAAIEQAAQVMAQGTIALGPLIAAQLGPAG
jgi:AcrR family transcriptional regulator